MAPGHEIAHLAHVTLLTPKLDESIRFCTDFLGLEVVGRDGDDVYLHAWDDYLHHSLTLRAHRHAGIARTTLRAFGPEELERRVAALAAAGRGIGWVDGEPGFGRTYLFTDPDGHEFGVFYDADWYEPGDETRPSLKNQAARYPGGGVPARRLDHVNFLGQAPVDNRDFLVDTLGAMTTEQIVLNDGTVAAAWTTFGNKSYDLVYTRDNLGLSGRLHHIAFAADSRADILRACDVALDQGVFIETGPHKHAIQQTFFLYVYEPGGNRIELCNAGARLILAPDWKRVDWTEAERAKGQAWGLKTIESFHTHGTPTAAESAREAQLAGTDRA
ncbi:VOC family protein [Nocardia sp. alder85J]|uniref:VOC family protein n=1 Tax=Nocardia sp. alder85J TaxID=2862949 RepID=UPI001CD745DE|nr:VOC family protein [Nocardia sp. alder85J]MCX4090779.1 VOC family protein [Nocardia sp. alder85J]